MPELPTVRYASLTDVGMRRATNQDSLAIRLSSDFDSWANQGHLFVVADGMGGHAVGDLASRIVSDSLPLAWSKSSLEEPAERLQEAVHAANRAINDRALQNPEFKGMGTTCSVLNLSSRGAFIGHVGDSRVYRLRHGLLQQLTFDHSLQWEMIRLGRSTAENVENEHPRNVITRCLGPDLRVNVDIEGPFSVHPGDIFLLCSDGLTNHVSDAEIGRTLRELPVTESCRFLINLANCRGGLDNSTAIVVQIEQYPDVAGTLSDSAFVSPLPPAPAQSAPQQQAIRPLTVVGVLLTIIAAAACFLTGWMLMGVIVLGAGLLFLRPWRWSPKPEVTQPPLPVAVSEVSQESRPHIESCSQLRSSFLPQSPYRSTESFSPEYLQTLVADVLRELLRNAATSGWKTETQIREIQSSNTDEKGSNSEQLLRKVRNLNAVMRDFYAAVRGTGGSGI